MKKAVIFDLGGVLFYPPQRAIAAYEKELGLPRSDLLFISKGGGACIINTIKLHVCLFQFVL